MGNGMNKTVHGVYIGSLKDSRDVSQLREHGIRRMISLLDGVSVSTPASNGEEEISVLKIKVPDIPTENISRHFAACNQFIHQARLDNHAVLVHCAAGVSRSVTVLCAYIMTVTRLGCEDVLKAVRGARKIANPNAGFHRQLREYERSKRVLVERARLLSIFGPDLDKFEVPDIITCNQLIQEFGRFVLTELKRQKSAQLGQSQAPQSAGSLLPPPSDAPERCEIHKSFSVSHAERARYARDRDRDKNYKFIDEDEDECAKPWIPEPAKSESKGLPNTDATCTCSSSTGPMGDNWACTLPRSVSSDTSNRQSLPDRRYATINGSAAKPTHSHATYLACTCYCTCSSVNSKPNANGHA